MPIPHLPPSHILVLVVTITNSHPHVTDPLSQTSSYRRTKLAPVPSGSSAQRLPLTALFSTSTYCHLSSPSLLSRSRFSHCLQFSTAHHSSLSYDSSYHTIKLPAILTPTCLPPHRTSACPRQIQISGFRSFLQTVWAPHYQPLDTPPPQLRVYLCLKPPPLHRTALPMSLSVLCSPPPVQYRLKRIRCNSTQAHEHRDY